MTNTVVRGERHLGSLAITTAKKFTPFATLALVGCSMTSLLTRSQPTQIEPFQAINPSQFQGFEGQLHTQYPHLPSNFRIVDGREITNPTTGNELFSLLETNQVRDIEFSTVLHQNISVSTSVEYVVSDGNHYIPAVFVPEKDAEGNWSIVLKAFDEKAGQPVFTKTYMVMPLAPGFNPKGASLDEIHQKTLGYYIYSADSNNSGEVANIPLGVGDNLFKFIGGKIAESINNLVPAAEAASLPTLTPQVPTETPSSTPTVEPSATPLPIDTLTPTPVPLVELNGGAVMTIVDTPSTQHQLIHFSADAQIVFTGETYGDYYQVQNANNPKEIGWIPKLLVSNNPANPTILTSETVPWNQINTQQEMSMGNGIEAQLTIPSNHTGYFDLGKPGRSATSFFDGGIFIRLDFFQPGHFDIEYFDGKQKVGLVLPLDHVVNDLSMPTDNIVRVRLVKEEDGIRVVALDSSGNLISGTNGIILMLPVNFPDHIQFNNQINATGTKFSSAPDGQFKTDAEVKATDQATKLATAQIQQTIAAKPTLVPTASHENIYSAPFDWNGQDADGTQLTNPGDLITRQGEVRKFRFTRLQVGPTLIIMNLHSEMKPMMTEGPEVTILEGNIEGSPSLSWNGNHPWQSFNYRLGDGRLAKVDLRLDMGQEGIVLYTPVLSPPYDKPYFSNLYTRISFINSEILKDGDFFGLTVNINGAPESGISGLDSLSTDSPHFTVDHAFVCIGR